MTAIGTPHVIYQEVNYSAIWARPLLMFMSEIDGHYRFENLSKD